uniref:Ig-like domain-containing protein n=1 Tax=Zonotrichia albicollis TaxID=44394 RepID=A0A8D2QA27_ZONAL
MFCLSFGWPQRPCSQGVCATWMGCTGGCDTDMSPCLSKSFEDHPDTLSHKNYPLVLQVPARPLLEGDTLTVCCRCRQDNHLTRVPFYREEKDLRESLRRTKLFLSPLQVYHSGHYRCEDLVGSWQSQSAPVTVTVHKLFSVPVLKGPRELTVQSLLNLSCCSTPSPLQPQAPLLHVFYRDEQVAGGLQSCQVHSEEGSVRKSSARLHITVDQGPGTPQSPLPSFLCSCQEAAGKVSGGRGRCRTPASWSPSGQGVSTGGTHAEGDVTHECHPTQIPQPVIRRW